MNGGKTEAKIPDGSSTLSPASPAAGEPNTEPGTGAATGLTKLDPKLLGLIYGAFGPDGLPLPFVQEIFLLECRVAGTSHLNLTEVEPGLAAQQPLVFQREPENPHDGLAIRIMLPSGEKLGYIPKDRNEVCARLMDAGKLLFGRLEDKVWSGSWLRLDIRVFMRDY